jgi:REP-associated tyrosine transposase
MRNLLGAHARRFNERHRLEGHVWAQKYFAKPIDVEAYLLEACAYVVLNPIRAGICAHPQESRWSSYRATAALEPRTAS